MQRHPAATLDIGQFFRFGILSIGHVLNLSSKFRQDRLKFAQFSHLYIFNVAAAAILKFHELSQ
jgi:hypothetical protein